MLRILHGTNYDFIRWWKHMAAITAAFILTGLILLFARGVNYSIEFLGGTLMQVHFTAPPHVDELRALVNQAGYPGAEIQQFGSPDEYTIRALPRAGGDTASATDS